MRRFFKFDKTLSQFESVLVIFCTPRGGGWKQYRKSVGGIMHSQDDGLKLIPIVQGWPIQRKRVELRDTVKCAEVVLVGAIEGCNRLISSFEKRLPELLISITNGWDKAQGILHKSL